MCDKLKNQYLVTESTVLRVYDLFRYTLVNNGKSKLYSNRITNYSHIVLLTSNISFQKNRTKKGRL